MEELERMQIAWYLLFNAHFGRFLFIGVTFGCFVLQWGGTTFKERKSSTDVGVNLRRWNCFVSLCIFVGGTVSFVEFI